MKHLKLVAIVTLLTSAVGASPAKEIVILGTNDLHGALLPSEGKTKDPTPVAYSQAGAAILGAYVQAYREHYRGRFLYLDAGDQWQGSLESNAFEGYTTVQVLNLMGLNAATIGNHEFDFGPNGDDALGGDPQGALRARMKDAAFPYLSANFGVRRKDHGKYRPLPDQRAYRLFQIDGVRIGVFGVTTEETPATTRPGFVQNATFKSLIDTTRKFARHLREERRADLVILLAHAGTRCNTPDAQDPLMENKIRARSDAGDRVCNPNEELSKLLAAIEPGTVDAVVGGHAHEIVHHWIHGTPVIQSGKFGQYVHLIHAKVGEGKPEITLEGPIPVCEMVFANQGHCDGRAKAPAEGRGELVPATLFGQNVVPDARIQAYLASVSKELEPIKSRVIARVTPNADIVHEKFKEAPMGNLVADAVRWVSKANFAMVNRGGIRDSWKGLKDDNVTFGDVYRVLPFDNYIKMADVSGAQLRAILNQAYNSPDKDVWPVSGLQVTLTKATSPYGVEILDARETELKAILDSAPYTLAVPDFIAEGGDGMGKVFSGIPTTIVNAGFMRDVLVEYLKTWKEPLNPSDLLDPNAPRVILE